MPRKKPPTAAQALKLITPILNRLDEEERRKAIEAIAAEPLAEARQGESRAWQQQSEVVLMMQQQTWDAIPKHVDHALAKAKKARDAPPRYTVRDADIVHLKDEKGFKFKQIAKHKEMEEDAARKAYHREKGRQER